MRLLLLLLLVAFPAASCRKRVVIKPPPPPANTLVDGTFITSFGSWFYTEKSGTVTLRVEDRGTGVHWKSTYAKHNSSGSGTSIGNSSLMNLPGPGVPWFIYVETPERLWLFDGVDNLTYAISGSGKNLNRKQAISGGRLEPDHEPIPGEIIPRLPAELQKLVPPVEAQRKRPSI